jgi:hypothetical protein
MAVAKMALAAGQKTLAAYSHRLAPKKYTQPQLFACLVLKSFFRTDYRGMVALLRDLPQLQQSLGLSSVPHYTTLQKACARLLRQACCDQLLSATLGLAQPRIKGKRCAAMDSSGFDCGHSSRYFVQRKAGGYSAQAGPRARQKTTYRRYGKLHLVVDCATHLAVAIRADQGPRPDGPHFDCLLAKALQQVRLNTILADGGYDSEAHHEQARNQRQVRSVIRRWWAAERLNRSPDTGGGACGNNWPPQKNGKNAATVNAGKSRPSLVRSNDDLLRKSPDDPSRPVAAIFAFLLSHTTSSFSDPPHKLFYRAMVIHIRHGKRNRDRDVVSSKYSCDALIKLE